MTDGTREPASDPRRGRLLTLVPVVVFVALAGLFAARLGAGDPSHVPSALIGEKVPPFALPPLAGIATGAGAPLPGLSDRDLAQGGVTVVNVWASWCGPCRLEHPLLARLAAEPDLRVVGINYKDKPEAAARFLQALGNPYAAVGRDESGRTAIDWGVYGVPETFVVAADGTIRYKQVGPLAPETMPAFEEAVRAARARETKP